MSEEKCVRCGDIGEDRRTLWLACLYEMGELGLPFEEVSLPSNHFYTLRVCKDCRASWLRSIVEWFRKPSPMRESPGTGIFVREFGTNVELTEQEWNQLHPDREPFRVKNVDHKTPDQKEKLQPLPLDPELLKQLEPES